MAYGQKYQMEFTDLDNHVILVIISQDGFTGELTSIIGSNDPFITKLDKQGDDRFEQFKPTGADINIFVSEAGDYDEFYEIDNFEYKVEKWIDGIPEWSGYINDEIFTESIADGRYMIHLTATDGMSILKGRYTALTGRISHLDMIRECLDAIGLDLNIVDAIGITEANHITGGPLIQTYFDSSFFIEDKTRWTLEKVLRDILKTYGANITQVHNKWVITNVESYYGGISGWEYTKDGVLVGVYSDTDEKIITHTLGPDKITLLTGGQIQKNKGYRELKVKCNFGKIDSKTGLIPNGDFKLHPGYSAGDDYSGTQSTIFLLENWECFNTLWPHIAVKIRTNNVTGDYVYIIEPSVFEGDYWIRTKLEDAVKLEYSATKTYTFSFLYALLASTVIFGSEQYCKVRVEVVNDAGVTTHWLDATNKAWVTEATNIKTAEVDIYKASKFNWTEGKVEVVGFPGGRVRVTLISEHKSFSLQYTGVAFGNIQFYSNDVYNAPSSGTLIGYPYVDGEMNKYTEIPEGVEFTQTDVPINNQEDVALSFKNYLSFADGTPTYSWQSLNYSGTLAQIYLFAYLEAHGRSIRIRTIPGRGLLTPHTRLIDNYGRKYQIISYSHSDKINQFSSCEIVEIIEPKTIDIHTNFNAVDSSSGGSSSDGETTTESNGTSDDRLVALLADSGMESGAPGKLYDFYFGKILIGSTLAYFPKRLSTLKSGKAIYNIGTYNISFVTPFNNPYMVSLIGSNGVATTNVILISDSNLNYFTIKVTVNNTTVRWIAYELNNN